MRRVTATRMIVARTGEKDNHIRDDKGKDGRGKEGSRVENDCDKDR